MDKQDQQFKELMQNYRPRKAPVDFSKKVMDKIHQLPAVRAYKPVFGKWFLHIFMGVLAVFISVVLILNGSGTGSGSASGVMDKLPIADLKALDEANRSFVGWFEQIPLVLILAMMGIAVLLIFDTIYSKRYHTRKA